MERPFGGWRVDALRSHGWLLSDPWRPLAPTSARTVSTAPSANAPFLEPFNRPERIGWHSDFSTYRARPRFTISYIERADPRGPLLGAWRVAPTNAVLAKLDATATGRAAMRFFRSTLLPFAMAADDQARFFKVVVRRGKSPSQLGVRFYARTMRIGAMVAWGTVPSELDAAIRSMEDAADEVGTTIPAVTGAALVVDNWFCLHDRLEQTVEAGLPLRRARLVFIP